ncbi:NUDIX hydrolase [Eionea flava]
MNDRWKPNVTVATVVERINTLGDKEYLLVHEIRDGQAVYNQPAGHLDEGESLASAAIRETREETGWEVKLTHIVGIYRFIGNNGITYLRHVFAATPIKHHPAQPLDKGIIDAVWMTYETIMTQTNAMRSNMVKSALDDYLLGKRYALEIYQ